MEKTIEIPEGYEARIEGNKIILEPKESEDERIIGRIKKAVESYWSDEPLDEILAWLEKQGSQNLANSIKTCKDEQNPDWSEDDEKMYTATIVALAGFMGNGDKLEWLKSLKERYTWKPSEEQIETLNEVIKEAVKMGGRLSKYSKKVQCLESLYNVLKKLKG